MAILCVNHAALLPNVAKEPLKIKVGIYPGAFDPIHEGHVAFARAAMLKHGLDKVFFLPEPSPRHKQAVKALEHRTAMVHAAVDSDPKFGVILLDQTRFTVHETWPLLVSRFQGADLSMLLGSDVAQRLASWPNIAELVQTAPRFIIALRGDSIADVKDMMTTLEDTKKLTVRYSLLDPNYPTYGSSKIRLAIKQGHHPDAVHPAVWSYIVQNGLYSSGETGEK